MPTDITSQLRQIASSDDFASSSAELAESWSSAAVGLEAVEPILRFMEEHPEIDYGTPGPLVHFVERFYGHGYEQKLITSIERKPTAHTVWMLNRIINGAKTPEARSALITVMRNAGSNPHADPATIERINHFLE